MSYRRISLNGAWKANPRLLLREEVVEGIVTQLRAAGEFTVMHAPIVRPVNSHYEIVSGHHRMGAAKRAGLAAIPCWVADLTDEQAFMQLVLSASQR
jgi:ParB family chromosome partitioning protein